MSRQGCGQIGQSVFRTRRQQARAAIQRACARAMRPGEIERLEERRMLSVVYNDDYSANTSANYVETTSAAALQDSWTIANGTLNYAVSATNGWNTAVYLVKPSVASTAGQTMTTTSGDLIAPKNYQPGLVLSGDPTNGGFVVAEFDNGVFNNHVVLLRETGGQLVGDEGGVTQPIPVLADFGDISANNTDTFHVVGTIDRTGAHPVITVTITDLTNPAFTIAPQTVTDTTDPATYGGNQIGWRARFSDTTAVFSVDNLHLENNLPAADHAPAVPTNLTATQAATNTNVNLSWTNPGDNVYQFVVERSTDGVNFSQLAVVPAPTTTYTDPIVSPPGATYFYRVKAVNGFNGFTVSAPSNVASVTIGSSSAPTFTDDYSTDTSANYTETTDTSTGASASWSITGGQLNYQVSAAPQAFTSLYLLNPNVASTAGMYKFTTSGDVVEGSTPAGLVLSGDATNGGFVVALTETGALAGHMVLMRLTGAQMTGDEGGIGNPPVLADLGDISGFPGDTFHIAGTVDRTTAHPVLSISVTDLTNPSFTIASQTVTDTIDPSTFGGSLIGWRVRTNDSSAHVVFDNLMLQQIALPSADHAPAAPTNLTGSELNGTVTLHWTNNADNATDLIVERSTNPTGGFVAIADVTPGAPGSTGTFTDQPIGLAGDSFSYRVVAFNGFHNGTRSPSNVVSITLSSGAGAVATYYNQGFWGGTAVDRQNVLTVDYNDPNGNANDPAKVTNNSENSIAWSGKIKITTPGTYTFVSNTSNDGYLYVDGVLVSSDPGTHVQRDATNLTPLTLGAGQYDFVYLTTWARYVGFDGNEGAHLSWITPGNTTPVIIPTLSLNPISDTPAVPGAPVVASVSANAVDLTFTANNNAVTRYRLQRSGDGGTTWATISQIDPGSNSQSGGVPGNSVTMKIEDAAPVQGATYQYRVIAVGADASSAPSAASAAVVVPAYNVSPTTPGAEAHYMNGELWKTGSPSNLGSPDEFQTLTANAPGGTGVLDYNIGGNTSIDPTAYPDVFRIHPISYSTVFTGKIRTDAAGMYTFISNTDDDGYFYVNDVLVSSDPGGHGPEIPTATRIVPISLQANTNYDFVFLFNQDAGGSAIHATWIEPGSTATTANAPPIPLATASTGGFLMASDTPHQITVDASGVITDTPTGSAAGNLTATAGTSNITLAWTNQSTSEIWFEVQRGTSATGPFTTIGTAGLNATGFTDSTATAGTHYFYRVRGVNYDGVGPYSNVGDATIGASLSQTVTGTSGNDSITIKKDATNPGVDDIWVNVPTTGAPTMQADNTKLIMINGQGGSDTLVIDSSNGQAIPAPASGAGLQLNEVTGGSFTLGGTPPTLDATHKVDVTNATVNIPYTGTSILPAVQSELKNGLIFSSNAAGSSGKFGISDTDASGAVTLKYSVIGDLNRDGTVAFADLLALAQHYNNTGADWSKGDLNYDGTVGFADLLALAQHYNQTAASAPAVAAASPTLASQTLDSLLTGKKARRH